MGEVERISEGFSFDWVAFDSDLESNETVQRALAKRNLKVESRTIKGSTTSWLLGSLFNDQDFRTALHLFSNEPQKIYSLSPEEQSHVATLIIPKNNETSPFQTAKIAEETITPKTQEAVRQGINTTSNDGEGLVWLQQQTNEGDMWAKYFLARVHLIAGLKIKYYDTFESQALSLEARPYWDAFRQVLQQETFKGDIFYARQLSEEGVKAGFGPLECVRGIMNLRGLGGLPLDYKEAARWYRQAADHGHARALATLGWLYENGKGVEKNFSEAVRSYRKGADLGHALSMSNLGLMYVNGQGVRKDVAEGMRWHRKAAALGESEAMFQLGWHYENEIGVSRNYSEAVQWFKKAADREHPSAMNFLGLHYLYGSGIEKDLERGISWIKKSAEHQNTVAMRNLGTFYAKGHFGLSQNRYQAITWYKKAADLGDENAMLDLGSVYDQGGSHSDHQEAWRWYMKAAERGNDKAMVSMALKYQNGVGTHKDEKEAVYWLEQAEKTTKDPKLRKEIHEILYARRNKGSDFNWGKVFAGIVVGGILLNALSGDSGDNAQESSDEEPFVYDGRAESLKRQKDILDNVVTPLYQGF